MYGQLPKSVPICSKCVIRWQLVAFAARPRSSLGCLRFQSTASNPDSIEERYRDKDHHDEPRTRTNSRPVKYRHWKPHESRKLGVDTLGKPAEVLILPSRERRIPAASLQDTNEQKPSKGILIESESSPISWEEIQSNLVTVRDSIINAGDTLIEIAKWKELRKVVARSFTGEQLKKYLLENIDGSPSLGRNLETASKRAVTSDIMTSIWKLQVVPDDHPTGAPYDQSQETANQPASKRNTTEQLKVNKAALDVALVGEGRILKNVSEQCHVKIDVFRDRSKVSVTGDDTNVKLAKQKLESQLMKNPYQKAVELSEPLKFLIQNQSFEGYLKILMENHPVRISRKPDCLVLSSFDKASLDIVHQDIIRIARPKHRNAGKSTLKFDEPKLVKARQYPSVLADWITQQQVWYRERSISNDRQVEQDIRFGEAFLWALALARHKMLKNKMPHSKDMHHLFAAQAGSLHTSLEANLGQVLSNNDRAVPTVLQTAFVTEMSLLPQFLASDVASFDTASPQQQTITLRLEPCAGDNKLPSFHIHMTGNHIDQGLRQPLTMTGVTAHFGSAIYDMLLPSENVDVRVTTSTELVLFDSKGPPMPRHAPLLKKLAAIIQDIQTQGTHTPVHQIDLLPLFKDPGSSTAKGSSLSEDVLQVLSKIKKSKTAPMTASYFLEPPEWSDMTTYTSSQYPGIQIEHTIQGFLLDEGSGNRHSLRIAPSGKAEKNGDAEKLIGEVGDSESDMLAPVVNAAVDLARKFTLYNNTSGEPVESEES